MWIYITSLQWLPHDDFISGTHSLPGINKHKLKYWLNFLLLLHHGQWKVLSLSYWVIFWVLGKVATSYLEQSRMWWGLFHYSIISNLRYSSLDVLSDLERKKISYILTNKMETAFWRILLSLDNRWRKDKQDLDTICSTATSCLQHKSRFDPIIQLRRFDLKRWWISLLCIVLNITFYY